MQYFFGGGCSECFLLESVSLFNLHTLTSFNTVILFHYIFNIYSVYIIFVGSLGVLKVLSFSLNSILCPLYPWPFPFPSSCPFILRSAKISQVCFPCEYMHHWLFTPLAWMFYCFCITLVPCQSLLSLPSLSVSLGIFLSGLFFPHSFVLFHNGHVFLHPALIFMGFINVFCDCSSLTRRHLFRFTILKEVECVDGWCFQSHLLSLTNYFLLSLTTYFLKRQELWENDCSGRLHLMWD